MLGIFFWHVIHWCFYNHALHTGTHWCKHGVWLRPRVIIKGGHLAPSHRHIFGRYYEHDHNSAHWHRRVPVTRGHQNWVSLTTTKPSHIGVCISYCRSLKRGSPSTTTSARNRHKHGICMWPWVTREGSLTTLTPAHIDGCVSDPGSLKRRSTRTITPAHICTSVSDPGSPERESPSTSRPAHIDARLWSRVTKKGVTEHYHTGAHFRAHTAQRRRKTTQIMSALAHLNSSSRLPAELFWCFQWCGPRGDQITKLACWNWGFDEALWLGSDEGEGEWGIISSWYTLWLISLPPSFHCQREGQRKLCDVTQLQTPSLK